MQTRIGATVDAGTAAMDRLFVSQRLLWYRAGSCVGPVLTGEHSLVQSFCPCLLLLCCACYH